MEEGSSAAWMDLDIEQASGLQCASLMDYLFNFVSLDWMHATHHPSEWNMSKLDVIALVCHMARKGWNEQGTLLVAENVVV